MSTVAYPDAPDLTPEDYLLVGVATCFIKTDGEVESVTILEPIPSAYAETITSGEIPTAYKEAFALTLGQVLQGGTLQRVASFPEDAQFCADFPERAYAASRTYQRNPGMIEQIPVGERFDRFNYTTQPKRVLNAKNRVSKEDNVKQHEYTHKVL